MRDYGIITPGFWIGETGRRLRGDPLAQVVALYLCSNPHANMIGLYHLPIVYISNDTGSPFEGASEALRRVCAAEFALYDDVSEVVFVPSMARFQVAEHLTPKDKRRFAVEKELEKWRKHRFSINFYDLYVERFSLEIARPIVDETKPIRSPFEAPSKPRSGSGSGSGTLEEENPSDSPLPPTGGDTPKKSRSRRKPDPEPEPATASDGIPTTALAIRGKDGQSLTPKDVLTAWDHRWQALRGTVYVRTAAPKEASLASRLLKAAAKAGLSALDIGAAMDRFFDDPFYSACDFSTFASKFASFTQDRAPDPRKARFTQNDPLLRGPNNGKSRVDFSAIGLPPRSVPGDVHGLIGCDNASLDGCDSEGLPRPPSLTGSAIDDP